MTEDQQLAEVVALVEQVAPHLRPLYPNASSRELVDITLRHLIGHVEGNVGVWEEERAEYWYLQAYARRLAPD